MRPEFFFTTPFDFFATVTDQTPGGTCTGSPVAGPEIEVLCDRQAIEDRRHTRSSARRPSSFSTFAAIGLPSFFMRATVSSTPAASHSSNGPSSQLKPNFIARSISTTVSEISGMRLAE